MFFLLLDFATSVNIYFVSGLQMETKKHFEGKLMLQGLCYIVYQKLEPGENEAWVLY